MTTDSPPSPRPPAAPSAIMPAQRLLGRFASPNPGPTFLITCAVHGNETAGVRACNILLEHLSAIDPAHARGSVACIVGNMHALASGARYIDRDLNRLFTPENLQTLHAQPHHDTEQTEALELLDLIHQQIADAHRPIYALDLHTVSADSPPFVFVEDSLVARRFARSMALPIVLGFEEELTGLLIDHLTNTHRIIAAILEAGRHDDPRAVAVMLATIRRALEHAAIVEPGTLPLGEQPVPPSSRPRIFDVRYRDPISSPDYRVDDTLHAFDPVRRGQIIARENNQPRRAPIAGILFMPNRQPVKRPGDDGYFLVQRINPAWLAVSAFLRSRRWIHALLPHLAPGVRRDPTCPARLLVDERYTPVFKREVFHLLGYRILRRGPEHHWPIWKRALHASIGICAAVVSMLLNAFRGGERTVLQNPSEHDWLVTRRTLDLEPTPGQDAMG